MLHDTLSFLRNLAEQEEELEDVVGDSDVNLDGLSDDKVDSNVDSLSLLSVLCALITYKDLNEVEANLDRYVFVAKRLCSQAGL